MGMWMSTSSYQYVNSTTSYFFIRVATLPTNSGKLCIETLTQSDVNYPQSSRATIQVSSWNNASISGKIDFIGSNGSNVELWLDSSRNVWLRSYAIWDSSFKWRIMQADGGVTVYKSAWTKQITAPTNSYNLEIKGRGYKFAPTAMSSPSAVYNYAHYMDTAIAETASLSPTFQDRSNAAYYLKPANTTVSLKIAGGVQIGTTTVIDASRNLTNITALGINVATPSYVIDARNPSDSNQTFRVYFPDSSNVEIGTSRMSSGAQQGLIINAQTTTSFRSSGSEKMRLYESGNLNLALGALQVGGTTVIDASRNVVSTSFASQLATTLFQQNVIKSSVASQQGAFIRMAVSSAANPTYAWEDDTDTGMYRTSANALALGVGGVGRLFISSSGNATFSGTINSGEITSTGNVTAYSDERLKSDIQTLDGKKVLQMRGVSFTKDGEAGSGVIAQELEKIAPELVHDGEYKSVAYGNITGYLIEAVKEQQKEIDELKSLVKQLLEK
jgi:hypothetical protein|tara:strand:- start:50 stop:1552 length:1503 start_codon:yes stop_codon:yes gene_type:complete